MSLSNISYVSLCVGIVLVRIHYLGTYCIINIKPLNAYCIKTGVISLSLPGTQPYVTRVTYILTITQQHLSHQSLHHK